jgi:uncharacterized SAM-binding protein YcdF (DUF218 family)
MSSAWLLVNAVSALLLPPLNLLLLCAVGVLLRRRWPRLGGSIALLSLAVLVGLSTHAGARLLARPLENRIPALDLAQAADAQAIVVLGGGRRRNAPEYGGQDVPRPNVLVRLRFAARLQRQTGLPLLLSGGRPDGAAESEAALMARVLREDFQASVRWMEEESDNTAQNAAFSAGLLGQAGISGVLLVTDALHMPRSQRIFEQTGLEVMAAPTNYIGQGALHVADFIPNAGALRDSHYALHEWIGLLWYRIAYHPRPVLPSAL